MRSRVLLFEKVRRQFYNFRCMENSAETKSKTIFAGTLYWLALPFKKTWRGFRALNCWLQALIWTLFGIGVFCLAIWVGVAWTIRETINNFGAKILGVDQCRVEYVLLNPFGCHVELRGLLIGKPLGGNYSHNLLEAKEINFDLEVGSLLTDTIVIEDLTVEGLSMTYEKPLTAKTNINAIVDHLSSAEKAEKEEAKKEVKAENDVPAKEIYIAAKHINIDGAQMWIAVSVAPVPMPPVTIKLDNVGTDSKLSPTMFGVRLLLNFLNLFNRVDLGAIGDAAGTAANATLNAAGTAAGATIDAATNASKAVLNLFGAGDDDEKNDKK